jgi:hypothetical protein
MQNNVIENRIRLKPYYFAYMDILGAKKYIESEESENYLNKIQRLYAETIELVKSNSKDFYLPKPKLKIFSDKIQFKAIADDNDNDDDCIKKKKYYTKYVCYSSLLFFKAIR